MMALEVWSAQLQEDHQVINYETGSGVQFYPKIFFEIKIIELSTTRKLESEG